MFNNIFDKFSNKAVNDPGIGLGAAKLPIDLISRKKITSSEFKKIVNEIFQPKIAELGFKGKDYVYYRENSICSETIFFWTYKYGGAIAVNTFIKFKNINYPDKPKPVKPKDVRFDSSEFHQRLSPVPPEKPGHPDVWFWILTDNEETNRALAEDILRLYLQKAIPFLQIFENPNDYISNITVENYWSQIDYLYFMHLEREKIFFLFRYWQLMNNPENAKKFAAHGISKLDTNTDQVYINEFQRYLDEIVR